MAHYKMSILGVGLNVNFEMFKLVPVGATLLTTVRFGADAAPAKVGTQLGQDDRIGIFMKKAESYVDITEKTTVVWIGERIDLICKFKTANTGGVLSNFNWTIPPTIVSNFFASSTNGYPIEFPSNAYSHSNVVFHWVRGSVCEVKCTVTVAGAGSETKAMFDVRNVSADWIAAMASPVAVNSTYWGAEDFPQYQVPWLHFGVGTRNTNMGMTFTLTNASLNGFPPARTFYFQCVQVGNNVRQFKNQGTNYLFVGNGLDSSYPYRQYPSRAVSGVDGDSPGAPCFSEYSQLEKSNAFDTYLMWRPSDVPSVPVPLKLLKWSWSGAASNTSGTWSLVGSNAVILQNNSPTSAYPQWTNNIQNVSVTVTPP